MLKPLPTPQTRAPRACARGAKTRVWVFCGKRTTRARRSAPQTEKPHLVAKATATKTASGVRYYGFRYYNPSAGRWLSRDPIEEEGGVNLYAMAKNDLLNRFDLLGLYDLQYDSTNKISAADKVRIEQAIKDAGAIAERLAKEAEALAKTCICTKLKAELEAFAKAMRAVENGVKSTSENLEIEVGPIKSRPGDYTEATNTTSPIPFVDPVLRFNTNPNPGGSGFGAFDIYTILHELSHSYETEDDDTNGQFMNAHTIEQIARGSSVEKSRTYIYFRDYICTGKRTQ
jgi:RHS repeat-associated protein